MLEETALGCETDGLRQADPPLGALGLWEAKSSLLRSSGNRANGEADGAELMPKSLRGHSAETGCWEDCSAGEKVAGVRGRIQPPHRLGSVLPCGRRGGTERLVAEG